MSSVSTATTVYVLLSNKLRQMRINVTQLYTSTNNYLLTKPSRAFKTVV